MTVAMVDHITAVQSILTAAGWTSYYGDVPDTPTYPYVLLWSSAGNIASTALCGTDDDLDESLGVTVTAGTPMGVLTVQQSIRAALNGVEPAVTGRRARLDLSASQRVEVDTDVTITATNRHPAYGVDLYRYRSTAA